MLKLLHLHHKERINPTYGKTNEHKLHFQDVLMR